MSESGHGAETVRGATHTALSDVRLVPETGEVEIETEGCYLDDEQSHVEVHISLDNLRQRVALAPDEARAFGEDLITLVDELEEMGNGE